MLHFTVKKVKMKQFIKLSRIGGEKSGVAAAEGTSVSINIIIRRDIQLVIGVHEHFIL